MSVVVDALAAESGARVAAVHTSVRELAVPFADTGVAPDCVRSMTLPALLLVGGESPPSIRRAVSTLAAVMPNARVSVLQGRQHMAVYEAPQLFAERVITSPEAGER